MYPVTVLKRNIVQRSYYFHRYFEQTIWMHCSKSKKVMKSKQRN